MSKHKVDDIRNIALCGHGGSGKTTLADKLLVKTGAVNGEPSVDAGTSICDFDPEEKAHKRTIESSVIHLTYAGKRFNIIDTPGYGDFIGQTIGALRGTDVAVIVINAHSGIEVNTRRVFQEAGAEWREAGCSMCIAMNGDQLQPGEYSVSTSNRNFEGRQGKGGRTFLASPLTAAASAITGVVTDIRTLGN